MPNFRSAKKSKSHSSQASGSASTTVVPAIGTAGPSSSSDSGWSTTRSGLLVTLDIVKESSDWLGPLKGAAGGLSAVITHCQRYVSNKEDAERILRRIESLEQSFATQPPDDAETQRRQKFVEKLGPITNKLRRILDQGRISGLVKNMDQAQMITSTIEEIREAILDYQTSLQQAILKSHCQLVESADRVLLGELPRAKGAGYLSGDGRKCMTGTRVELLQEIEAWAEDPRNHRVFWLNGVAGGGKSAIARTLAERVFAGGDLGGSFFCSRDFAERNDLNLIFPTIAYDLAHRYSNYRACLIEVIKSSPNVGHESLSNQLEKLLVEPLRQTGLATMIIIDALDECKDPDDQPASVILSLLARHIDKIPSVKFFITGRPEARIRDGFRLPLLRPHTEVLLLHKVDRKFVDRDIEIFIRNGLSELSKIRSDMDEDHPWPEDNDVLTLVHKSGGLFIYADTMLKFIASDHEPPELCLRLITSTPDGSAYEGPLRVDPLYTQVLDLAYTSVGSRSSKVIGRFQDIVGAIVLLFNPLSRTSLESLLNIPSNSIYTALRSLHSVLLVPDSDSTPIQIFHKSFPDYITDPSRCRDRRFCINPTIQHLKIAMLCLELMQKRLKKNICNLPPYAMNSDIEDLPTRINECIGDTVEYVCLFWAQHLKSASEVESGDLCRIIELLKYFFDELLLYWLEVLSIIGRLRDAIHILHDVQVWFAKIDVSDGRLSDWIVDAERFILFFFDLIEKSALHIYASALPWSPISSLVRNQYEGHLAEMKILNGVDPSWNACIRIISADGSDTVEFSHKGDRIATGGNGIMIFEAATGVRLATFGGWCHAIAFSPDDTLLVSVSDGVKLWDLQTGALIRELNSYENSKQVLIQCCTFSPSGLFVASGDSDGNITIWDILSGSCNCTLQGHLKAVISVGWSPKGTLLSGSRDGIIRTWDVSQRICSKVINCYSGKTYAIAFSLDCSTAAIAKDSITVLDVETGDLIRSIPAEQWTPVSFSPKADWIIFAKDLLISVCDLAQGVTISKFPTDDDIMSATFSPDGNSIVSLTGDPRALSVWSIRSADQDVEASAGMDYISRFIADGRLVAFYENAGNPQVSIWDARTGSLLQTVRVEEINSIRELPNLSLLLSHFWDLDCDYIFVSAGGCSDHEVVACYDLGPRVVRATDGQWLALYGWDDDTVKVWDGVTGSYMHTFGCPSSIESAESSPDSSQLVCSYKGGLRVWNIANGKRVVDVRVEFDIRSIFEFNPSATSHSGPDISTFRVSAIPSFCFSPTGDQIAVWANLNWSRWPTICIRPSALNPVSRIFLYNMSTGYLLAKQVVEYPVKSVSFSMDRAGLSITDDHGHATEFHIPELSPSFPSSLLSSRRLPRRQFSISDDCDWVKDQAGRKVCWIPPTKRCCDNLISGDCHGKVLALPACTGTLATLDFSNVTLDSL